MHSNKCKWPIVVTEPFRTKAWTQQSCTNVQNSFKHKKRLTKSLWFHYECHKMQLPKVYKCVCVYIYVCVLSEVAPQFVPFRCLKKKNMFAMQISNRMIVVKFWKQDFLLKHLFRKKYFIVKKIHEKIYDNLFKLKAIK